MASYYFACSYPLGEGSIIKKGNWGRICRLESVGSFNAGNFQLIMELVFENVRLKDFPTRPSRLESVFLCPNPESLKAFVAKFHRPFDLLYEVELVDNAAMCFETDWNLASANNYANMSIDVIEQAAHKYWSPQTVQENAKEFLVKSDVKIIKLL